MLEALQVGWLCAPPAFKLASPCGPERPLQGIDSSSMQPLLEAGKDQKRLCFWNWPFPMGLYRSLPAEIKEQYEDLNMALARGAR